MYEAIRRSKGPIKCSIYLSPVEYQNKAEVYKQARRWGLDITDKGDTMTIKNAHKTGLLEESTIWLDRP